MSTHTVSRRAPQAVTGALVLMAVSIAAIYSVLPKTPWQYTRAVLESGITSTGGFAEVVSLKLDSVSYNGQQACMTMALDVLLPQNADPLTVDTSMKAAGNYLKGLINVYRKLVVTGYARRADFDNGLAFRSRAVWLSPELAAPLEGWIVVRLPDEPREPARALDGIYAAPTVVKADAGALVATVDLAAEERRRPAARIEEILAAPLIDCVDFDNVFSRSPGLESVDVTVLDSGHKVARFAMTRKGYEATAVSLLLGDLSRRVLTISNQEVTFAEKYTGTGLFTPLLFDKIVSAEDKEALAELRTWRHEAEEEFYTGLFANGVREQWAAPDRNSNLQDDHARQ